MNRHRRRRSAALALAAVLLAPAGAVAQPAGEAAILSTYGSRLGANKRPRLQSHAGVDFGAKPGSPVLAAADGVVSKLIDAPLGCGIGVVLDHPGFGRHTAYCHLRRARVRVGQRVVRGETIGLVGTTGNAVGVPHVHFELCTAACSSHADGDLRGTADPLRVADGCFDSRKSYPRDRLVLTFPVPCLYWAWEKYR